MKKYVLVFCFILTIFSYSFAGWEIETVDSTDDVGEYTSIALDSSNHPHISYRCSTNQSLKYAYYDGLIWQISTLDSGLNVGCFSSIALDDLNQPHISYLGYTYLKYAHLSGSSWQITTIDQNGYVGNHTSIAIDSNNQPHISYQEYINMTLKYAFFDGSSWQASTVGTDFDTGYHTSIALDFSDDPHISCIAEDLKYAYYNGSSWQIDSAAPIILGSSDTSLSLDNNYLPHISYSENAYYECILMYTYYDGSSWQISMVDNATDVGGFNSLALDSSNHPNIAYYDGVNGALKYASFDGINWQISVVDSAGDVGWYVSLALDSNNNPHFSYYDKTYGNLKYARYVSIPGVSLLSFTAQPQPNSAIKLVWQVSASDDTQIMGFNLYRADAGKAHKKDWSKLNHSPIAGNNPYQFADSSVKAGQGYQYRLSALTADGKEEMMGTAQGEAGTIPAQFALTAVYPNPTSSLLTCRLSMPQAGSVTVGLYDISGRLVLSQRMDLPTGEQETALEVGNLAKGIYTVRASSSGESATKRIVVMR